MTGEGNVPWVFPPPNTGEGNRIIATRCSGNATCSLRSLQSHPRPPTHVNDFSLYYTHSRNKGNRGNRRGSETGRLAIYLFPSQLPRLGNGGNVGGRHV